MAKTIIQTDKAPAAIGTYSQAVKVDQTVYISGQIPLDPTTMEIVAGFSAFLPSWFSSKLHLTRQRVFHLPTQPATRAE